MDPQAHVIDDRVLEQVFTPVLVPDLLDERFGFLMLLQVNSPVLLLAVDFDFVFFLLDISLLCVDFEFNI